MDYNIRFVMGAAVAGILLGLAGLVFGVVSKNKADELREDFAQVSKLVDKIRKVEENSTGISADTTRLDREVNSLRKESQEAFNNVKTQLTRFSTDLNSTIVTARQLQDKVTDFENFKETVTAPPAPPPPAPEVKKAEPKPKSEVVAAPKAEKTGSVVEGEARNYTIQSGDTLSRIASNHQVSLTALETANPEVDERRLQIGQKIRIPTP